MNISQLSDEELNDLITTHRAQYTILRMVCYHADRVHFDADDLQNSIYSRLVELEAEQLRRKQEEV